MKDFYMQLTSIASQTEFPFNASNSFKNRLLHPLQFRELGWKVGLANITYPTPHIRPDRHSPQPPPNFESDDLICRIKWTMKSKDDDGIVKFLRCTYSLTGDDLIRDRMLITGGKALMWYIVNRFQVRLTGLVTDKEDDLLASDGKKYYRVFRWEGEDLILNNSDTFPNESGEMKRPEVVFGTKLVDAMQWVKPEDGNDIFMMNGNLMTEADSISKDVKKDWTYVDRFRSWSELWNYAHEGLQLSSYCNWRFIYLDEAYRKAFGGVHESVIVSAPHRGPMYLYSSVGQSTMLGNQVTDLLQEVPYALSGRYFEPRHVQHLPLPTNVIDIIETQVAENTGELVNFESGVMSVTLHFKYE